LFRSLVRRLPLPLLDPLRRTRRWLRSRLAAPPGRDASADTLTGPGPGSPPTGVESKNPLDFVKPETWAEIHSHLANPHVLFQMQFARQAAARDRAEHFFRAGTVAQAQDQSPLIASNTLNYNLDSAKTAAMFDRPMILTNVVSSIPRIHRNIPNVDVLSIGPRSEIEIFGLMAAGFSPDRIKAVDLFSYSPLVDVGDMHQLPYADNSFDVIFLGWVLSYSRDQQAVARELTRVARDRAIVAIAGDYSDDTRARPAFKNESTHIQDCDQLLELFQNRLRRVYFRHDPEPPTDWMVMTVFELKKD
jgi:hypothetical protein